MNPSTLERMTRLVQRLADCCSRLTIDADAHATDISCLDPSIRAEYETSEHYYHGRPVSSEELIDEMDVADVDVALIWQNPSTTVYSDDQDKNFDALLKANRYIADSANRYPERFVPGGWLDPRACGLEATLELASVLVRDFGFAILKMNPAQNGYPINSPEVIATVDRIIELGAVPAFHFGADSKFTPAAGLESICIRYCDHPILALHMGGGGASYIEAELLYAEARDLGLRRPNLHYVLSAKRDTHIESDLIAYQLAGPPFSRNLFCGSDAPYGRMSWNFGGFRAMFRNLIDGPNHTDPRLRQRSNLFSEQDCQNYLGRNFASFVVDAYRRLLPPPTECTSAGCEISQAAGID